MKAQDEQKKEQIKLWKVSTPPPPKADDEEGSANGDQNK
jgi:CheY-like chemotaxis protein